MHTNYIAFAEHYMNSYMLIFVFVDAASYFIDACTRFVKKAVIVLTTSGGLCHYQLIYEGYNR